MKRKRKQQTATEMIELGVKGCHTEDCLYLEGNSGPLVRDELFIYRHKGVQAASRQGVHMTVMLSHWVARNELQCYSLSLESQSILPNILL